MTLQQQLDRLRERERAQTPPAVLTILDQANRLLASTTLTEESLKQGDPAPDFVLPDAEGSPVALSSLLRQGPVVLSFFRGGWCPFCSLELRAYQQIVSSIESVGASLAAIGPESPAHLRETIRENAVRFPVLHDADNAVARRFGLVYRIPEALRAVYEGFGLDLPARNGSTSFELPVPATYLVDTEGRIRRSFVEVDPTRRGEPSDFLEGIRELREGS